MKKILLAAFPIMMIGCGKDPVESPTHSSVTATLTVDKTTIAYDGISYDSIVTLGWSTNNAMNAALNDQSVGLSGTKAVPLYNSQTFTLSAIKGDASATDTKTVTVTINPTLALLCGGWWNMTRKEYFDSNVWYDRSISLYEADDKFQWLPNRRELGDFGEKLEQNQRQYGFADTAFMLPTASKDILRRGNIDWKIVKLTQAELVLEGWVPGLWGSPLVYTRQTYHR
jgi:hypothetical protein